MQGSMKRVAVGIVVVLVIMAAALYGYVDYRNRHAEELEDGVVAFKKGDYVTAVELLSPLAEAGEPVAQDLLGIAYAYGYGVPMDSRHAQQLLQAAHGSDAKDSFFHIAERFEEGDRVTKDERQAVSWYAIAAEHGHRKAQDVLADAYREGRFGLEVNIEKAEYWEGKARNGG
jgi:TPR repeat protein